MYLKRQIHLHKSRNIIVLTFVIDKFLLALIFFRAKMSLLKYLQTNIVHKQLNVDHYVFFINESLKTPKIFDNEKKCWIKRHKTQLSHTFRNDFDSIEFCSRVWFQTTFFSDSSKFSVFLIII